jgi:hypothetical protein
VRNSKNIVRNSKNAVRIDKNAVHEEYPKATATKIMSEASKNKVIHPKTPIE